MKNVMRIVAAVLALLMSVGVFAGCGNTEAKPTAAPTVAAVETTGEATEASTPFIAPPDQIGLVTSADSQLITWQVYSTDEESLDFKNIKVKELGNPGEMELFYLEREVTYYTWVNGKLTEITVEDIVPGSVIGITTLEEGVQEVYAISIPTEDFSDESEDVEDFEEVEIPATTEFVEPSLPDDFTDTEEGPSEGDGV